MQVHQLHDGDKLKTVNDLIRDISGATFNEATSPVPDQGGKKNSFGNRSSSVAKSQGNSGSADATINTANRRRANTIALRSVNEVFSATENRAKFCLPLGLNSAREIEKCL